MTVSIEYIPVTPIEYPDDDGKPMAEGDIQCSYLTYGISALKVFFQSRSDVYVAGNLFIYYEKGNPEAVVAPDVFVVFGVENRQRRSYKTWEENNKSPDFVLEITSKATRSKDQGAKKGIYAFLGVREYFQYDPTGDYLTPQLQGLRLVEGNYFPIASNTLEDGTVSLTSEVLRLELRVKYGDMRFYDAATGKTLLTYEEEAAARQAAEEKAQKLAAKLRELNIDPDAL
ncbi:Uma2 family endonuclease [Tolypothrix sp. VBCCA 56010]|uniref:Uma2 family endonuclease n=1 Tax=Tolypothrix sp. VBCCA 56010 TaxID=3137731 RepID=UPI003D7EA3F7